MTLHKYANQQQSLLEMLNAAIVDSQIVFRVNDKCFAAGNPKAPDRVVINIRDPHFFHRVLCYGNLGLAEAFMDGDFCIEEGSLEDLLTILLRNQMDRQLALTGRQYMKLFYYRASSWIRGKRANVQAHYDLGNDLFECFLDRTMTYSCGYVGNERDNIDQLQENKLERICRKLRLTKATSLLDVGCGFGGLLIYAAKRHSLQAVGITLSKRQLERAESRIRDEGLAGRVRVELKDYKSITGHYDRIVSVGMMEHVPRREYPAFFKMLRNSLAPGGVGLLHTIGCNSYVNDHDPFIQRYIFPGSNQPRLSEIAENLEHNRLAMIDVENMIRHYGYTGRGWLERFRANKDGLNLEKYNLRFTRMWEYYLCCIVAAARASDAALYQILFTNSYTTDLPLHRV